MQESLYKLYLDRHVDHANLGIGGTLLVAYQMLFKVDMVNAIYSLTGSLTVCIDLESSMGFASSRPSEKRRRRNRGRYK